MNVAATAMQAGKVGRIAVLRQGIAATMTGLRSRAAASPTSAHQPTWLPDFAAKWVEK
jgi:hypothetical protein